MSEANTLPPDHPGHYRVEQQFLIAEKTFEKPCFGQLFSWKDWSKF